MLKVLYNILCDLDPKVKVKGQKADICDGVPSTSALVLFFSIFLISYCYMHLRKIVMAHKILVCVACVDPEVFFSDNFFLVD